MRRHTISFKNAWTGIVTAARTQSNIRVHLIVTTLVFILSVYFRISLAEALVLILTVSMVVVAELVNTALEFLSDAVTMQHNELIGHAKDVSAGAVLVAATFATIIGVVIFIPKLLPLIQ